MKNIILVLSLILIAKSLFCQQFIKKWEFPQELIYVGDIDGDGIGEFAFDDYNNNVIKFYNTSSQNVKWTITDMRFFNEIYDAEKSNLQPSYIKFPSVDFNGDGKKEMLLKRSDGKGITIYDIVNNTTVFEWSEPQLYSIKFLVFADVDGDGKLELVFIARSGEYGVDYKTYVYSTNAPVLSVNIKQNEFPNNFNLSQNFPNPFNPTTTIEFEISQPSNVKVNIYDVAGRMIKELINEQKNTGKYSVTWNGKDNYGNTVASGNYFYQIISGDYIQAKKMILLK